MSKASHKCTQKSRTIRSSNHRIRVCVVCQDLFTTALDSCLPCLACVYATYLYHVPLDEFCMQSLAQSSRAALDDYACGLESFDLGFGTALAAGNDGTCIKTLVHGQFRYE